MAMPAVSPPFWTAERVRALPDDGNRYECIDGALLVSPSPAARHQRAVRDLLLALAPFVRSHALGEVLQAPADLELEPGTLVQPDLFVLAPRADGAPVRDWRDVEGLRLAVEVLSPGTARYDRTVKRRFFQRVGVPEYWVVDLDARVVERWRPHDERPEIVSGTLVWTPLEGLACAIDLDALGASGDGG